MKRFISEDPLGYAAGDVNFYRYVLNNPANLLDPFGLWDELTGISNTWVNTGRYGANWSEFRKDRKITKETAVVMGVMASAPVAIILSDETAAVLLTHPEWMHRLTDFWAGYAPSSPPPSWWGYGGSFAQWIKTKLEEIEQGQPCKK